MAERTDQQPKQPSLAQLQPNGILSQPATVQACQQDYAAAADVRRTMARQEARRR
jgi:hypothetical protein